MTKAAKKEAPTLFEDPKATAPKPEVAPARPAKQKADPAPAKQPSKGRAVATAAPAPVALVPGSPEHMLANIAALIANPKFDPAKAQAIVDMRKQIVDEQSRREFIADFIAMQAELPFIRADGRIVVKKKDARGERTGPVQQSTPYATYENIMKIVKPILDNHGFALSCATEPSGDLSRLVVRGYLMHRSGHEKTSAFPLPIEDSGSKNSVQGWGSTQKYGRRYVAIALLNIVSYAKQDSDLDGAKPDDVVEGEAVLSAEEVGALRDKITACGVGEARFCEKYGIAKLEQLPARLLDEATTACLNYGRAAAQKGGAGG